MADLVKADIHAKEAYLQKIFADNVYISGILSLGFTSGSIVFSDGTNLTQDNSNLFWDNTSKRLGIKTNTPEVPLHVGTDSNSQGIRLERTGLIYLDIIQTSGNVAQIRSTGKVQFGANGNASTFIFEDNGAESKMSASTNDMVYEWIRGNNATQSIEFKGTNSEGTFTYFSCDGHDGASNQDDKIVFFAQDMEIRSDVVFTSEGGLVYGSQCGNEIAWTQAAVQNTWYRITDTDITTGHVNNVTSDGDGRFTIIKGGKYLINYSLSVQISIANKHIEGGILKNGTIVTCGRCHVDGTTANAQLTVASNMIIDCATNDTLDVGVRTTDSGTPTIEVDHINITITQIGE